MPGHPPDTAQAGPAPLWLGTANLGNLRHAMSDAEAQAVLEAAWEAGVRCFDTAPHYGLGLAEERLGRFLAGVPRDEVVVSTKVGRLLRPDPAWDGGDDEAEGFAVPARLRREWDLTPVGLRRSLEESLERLGLDHVDVALLHDPERHDLAQALDAGLGGLDDLRDAGLAARTGVGSMDLATLRAFALTGAVQVLMAANRLTLIDHAALAAEVLPVCVQHEVDVLAAAVFSSGLLATDEPGPDGLVDYRPAPDATVAHARELAALCRSHGTTLPAAALHFPLRHPRVRGVVAGAATPAEVRANARALATALPAALWDDLAAAGAPVGVSA